MKDPKWEVSYNLYNETTGTGVASGVVERCPSATAALRYLADLFATAVPSELWDVDDGGASHMTLDFTVRRVTRSQPG